MDPWQRVQAIATTRRVLAAFIVAVAFSAWFFAVGPYAAMTPHGGILDDRFGSAPDDLLDGIDAMGAAGRETYRGFLLVDLLFPVLHAAWMMGFLAIGARGWRALPKSVTALPVAAMLFDWAENLAFLALLAQHPDASAGVATVAAGAMHAKLVVHIGAGIAMLAVVGWMVMHPVKRGPRRGPRSARRGS